MNLWKWLEIVCPLAVRIQIVYRSFLQKPFHNRSSKACNTTCKSTAWCHETARGKTLRIFARQGVGPIPLFGIPLVCSLLFYSTHLPTSMPVFVFFATWPSVGQLSCKTFQKWFMLAETNITAIWGEWVGQSCLQRIEASYGPTESSNLVDSCFRFGTLGESCRSLGVIANCMSLACLLVVQLRWSGGWRLEKVIWGRRLAHDGGVLCGFLVSAWWQPCSMSYHMEIQLFWLSLLQEQVHRVTNKGHLVIRPWQICVPIIVFQRSRRLQSKVTLNCLDTCF